MYIPYLKSNAVVKMTSIDLFNTELPWDLSILFFGIYLEKKLKH